MNDKKCPNCNAIITSKDNKYKCDYCNSTFSEEEFNTNRKKNVLILNDSFDINTLKNPTKIIPFKKSKEDFLNVIKNNNFGKLFIANVFKKTKLEDIKSIYVPFYIFDIRESGDTIFKCTDINAKVKEDKKITYVKKYKTTINSKCDFIKLPICANKNFNEDILDGIEPFNNDLLIDYNIEDYKDSLIEINVNPDEVLSEASSKVTHLINDLTIKKSEHKISVVESNNANFDLINCKLVYYPIHYIEIIYKDTKYYYSMNGDDGKYDFDIPLSNFKMVIFTIIFMIVVFVVVFLLLLNL